MTAPTHPAELLDRRDDLAGIGWTWLIDAAKEAA